MIIPWIFNINVAQLEQERDVIHDLRLRRNTVVNERGHAQEATRLRNEKLDELADYCVELRAVAEIALENQPQLLENLGIVVR